MGELISIIIPVYNGDSYLGNCLESILLQTYPDIEIVVVDDGSSDRSGEIAEEYVRRYPDKIQCIHQENSGVTNARLNGIMKSSGNWIGFADADDELEPDMYKRLMSNAKKYDADISHCGHQTIVNDGERVHYFYNSGRIAVQDRKTALNDLLEGVFEPSLWTKLFKRDLVLKALNDYAIDQSIKYNEDLLMNYFFFSNAEKTIFEDFCAYHYLARSDSATRRNFRIEKVLDPVKVNKTILDSVDSNLENIAWHNYMRCCLNAYISLWNRPGYENQAKSIKCILRENWGKRIHLSRNERVKMTGMVLTPGIFKKVYSVYEKRFRKKIYE